MYVNFPSTKTTTFFCVETITLTKKIFREFNSLVKTLLSRNFCQKSESNLQLSHTEVHSNEIVPSFMNDEELGSGHAI